MPFLKIKPLTPVTEQKDNSAKALLIRIGAETLRCCGKESVEVKIFGMGITKYDTVAVLTDEINKLSDAKAETALKTIKEILKSE